MMRFTQARAVAASTNQARPSRTIRSLFAPIAIATASVLALSGCGVEVVGTVPVPSSTPPAASVESPEPEDSIDPEEESPTPAVADVDPSAQPEPTATEAGEPTEKDLARRSYYDDKIELTTGCPTGRIVIDQSMRVTKITEDCDEVIVTAAFTTLLAEHVGKLTIKVTGSQGHFITRSIGTATVAGAFNHIYWDSGKPVLHVSGFKCVVQPNPVKEK